MPNRSLLSRDEGAVRLPDMWPPPAVRDAGPVEMDDAWALSHWLGFISMRNAQTLRSYRTEVMRFRIFLECRHRDAPERSQAHLLRDASEIDVADYEAQLLGRYRTGAAVPPLWVPPDLLASYGRSEQPFVADDDEASVLRHRPRKTSSVNQALSILHALYQHWLKPDPQTKTAYVGANPVSRVKFSTRRALSQTQRAFPVEAVKAMLSAIELDLQSAAQAEDKRAKLDLERRRWIVALLFGLWARRAELARLTMADFTYSHTTGSWRVSVVRKGGREDRLPLATWVVEALVRYRTSLGMTPLPTPDETGISAIVRLRTHSEWARKPVSPEMLYRDVAKTGARAAQRLRQGEIFPDMEAVERETLATTLQALSPHWFRHSGASIAINTGTMTLESASKMLGHADPAMTASMYYHRSDAQLSDGIQKLGSEYFT